MSWGWRCALLVSLALASGCVRYLEQEPRDAGPAESSAESSPPALEQRLEASAGDLARDLTFEGLADASGDAPDGAVFDAAPFVATHHVYLALQGQLNGHVQELLFDAAADMTTGARAMVAARSSVSLPSLAGGLRSMTAAADGRLLVGSGYDLTVVVLPADASAISGQLSFDHGVATVEQIPDDAHGLCVLPGDGSLVVGEYSAQTGNAITQYSLVGSAATFARPVALTSSFRGVMAGCGGLGSDRLYAAELDATGDSTGDVVHYERVGESWSETSRLSFVELGFPQSLVYALAVHEGRGVYMLPMLRFGGRYADLLRCPLTSLTATGCTSAGPLPPDISATPNGADVLMAATRIDSTDELLFSSNRAVYRYRLLDGEYEEIFDLAPVIGGLRTTTGEVDNFGQVRGLVVR